MDKLDIKHRECTTHTHTHTHTHTGGKTNKNNISISKAEVTGPPEKCEQRWEDNMK